MELATDSMNEETHLITEAMKGESMKIYMLQKSDSPQPWTEKNPPRGKRK